MASRIFGHKDATGGQKLSYSGKRAFGKENSRISVIRLFSLARYPVHRYFGLVFIVFL